MSGIAWWVWLIIVVVVVAIIVALVVARKRPSTGVADNAYDPSASPHIPAGTAEDVSTSQAATTNSAGQAMTSGATAAAAAGVTGATSGARRMAEDDDAPDTEAEATDPRHSSTPDRARDDDEPAGQESDDAPADEAARAEEALEAEQPQREATDPERVAEEQRGAASDEEAPPVTDEPDETLGIDDSDEGMEQTSTPEVAEQPVGAGFASDDPEATEALPKARETDNVDATIAAEDPSHRTPSTHGRDAVETQQRLTRDLGLDPEDDPHAGHTHGGQSHRDASTGPGPDHKPYDFPQDTEASTGVPLADASEQLRRAEMQEHSRDRGYGEFVDSGEKHPELTVDPGSTPPVEEAGPDAQDDAVSAGDPAPAAESGHQEARVTEADATAAPESAAPEQGAPADAAEADAPTESDADDDYDIPRDEYGRRLDPYGNPVED